MLEIEKRIGCTLEEDYREHYTKKGWGQTRIAHRWRVPKVLIFFGNRRSNTPPWTERLGLEVKKHLTLSRSARITINCSMVEIRKRPNSRSRFSISEKRRGSSTLAQPA